MFDKKLFTSVSTKYVLFIILILSLVIFLVFYSIGFESRVNIFAVLGKLSTIELPQLLTKVKKPTDSKVYFYFREEDIQLLGMNRQYDSPDNHEFKSPYIIFPKLYSNTTHEKVTNVSRKTKTIGCVNCMSWFTNDELNYRNRDFKVCPYSECSFQDGLINGTADVVFFFLDWTPKASPPSRPPGQIWVKISIETPVYSWYPVPYEPWKSAYNWSFSYRRDSDLFSPYDHLAWRNKDDLLTREAYSQIARNKTKTAAWFVSRCPAVSKRMQYVKEMQKYIDVDIYGKCGTLKCGRAEDKICERRLTTTYKFYLSFENSFCKDYVTEKFFRVFQYRSHIVPVVRGGFEYEKFFPPQMFVNAANFSTAKDLALHLKALGNDHEKYTNMLQAKDTLTSAKYQVDWCKVCEKIHTDTTTKIIPDIHEVSHNTTCREPNDI